jgi:hypothetical protein
MSCIPVRVLTATVPRLEFRDPRPPAVASRLKSFDGHVLNGSSSRSAGELHCGRAVCPSEQQMKWSGALMDRQATYAETTETTTASCGRLRSGSHGDSKAPLRLPVRLEKEDDHDAAGR